MARPLRIEFAGALYHVTSRGDRREASLEDHEDRERSLGVLAEVVERHNRVCQSVGTRICSISWGQGPLGRVAKSRIVASASPEAFERYETGTRHIRRRGPATAPSSTGLLRGREDAFTGWCRDAAL
jgi:hypothetical protein